MSRPAQWQLKAMPAWRASLPEYGWQQLDDSDHVLKPNAINLATLQKNLQNHNIFMHFLPLALNDGYQMLSFTAGNSEAGTISTNGTVHIAAMGPDDLLSNQSSDFIKIDVEGGKIAALNGATRLITRCRPVQAVSFYSRPQVLWEIPQLLRVMCHDYQLFLCQHYYNSFDSVLCAVPH